MERDILVALFDNATLLLALSVIYEVVYILPLRNRHLQLALIGILIALTCSAVMSMVNADRTATPLSIAIFDIDNFKRVNDTKGHVIGDQVLVALAAILKKAVRGSDYIGRYGGEEFMVIFRDTGLSIAEKVSERVRQAIESYGFVEGLKITISGGVSQYHGETMTELIQSADFKLYSAKKSGKNQIVSTVNKVVQA